MPDRFAPYPHQGPFEQLYEAFTLARLDKRRAEADDLRRQLTSTYRTAWESGVAGEQRSVLDFLLDIKDPALADIVVDGLRSEDRDTAFHAAAVAVSLHRRIFDLGPQLRPVFRALVRRFPENEGFRPRDLYGHKPGDEDDSNIRPFTNLYEDWMVDEPPRDPDIRNRLLAMHREAWEKVDGVERAFVLHFFDIWPYGVDPPDINYPALILEGLQTHDPVLCRTAAHSADLAFSKGVDLGPGLRPALEAYRARFPERYGVTFHMLKALDKRDRKKRRPSARRR